MQEPDKSQTQRILGRIEGWMSSTDGRIAKIEEHIEQGRQNETAVALKRAECEHRFKEIESAIATNPLNKNEPQNKLDLKRVSLLGTAVGVFIAAVVGGMKAKPERTKSQETHNVSHHTNRVDSVRSP